MRKQTLSDVTNSAVCNNVKLEISSTMLLILGSTGAAGAASEYHLRAAGAGQANLTAAGRATLAQQRAAKDIFGSCGEGGQENPLELNWRSAGARGAEAEMRVRSVGSGGWIEWPVVGFFEVAGNRNE